MINRLISNSEISAAGQTIIINKKRVYPPFVIKAIGPVKPMLDSLETKGGVMEYIKFFGISVKIEENKKIFIPAYEEGVNFQFAKPIP